MSNQSIKEAKKILDDINASEEERELAESRMKYIMDMKSIKLSGFNHGKKERN